MGGAVPNDIREERSGEGWPALGCTLLKALLLLDIQTASPSNQPLGLGPSATKQGVGVESGEGL